MTGSNVIRETVFNVTTPWVWFFLHKLGQTIKKNLYGRYKLAFSPPCDCNDEWSDTLHNAVGYQFWGPTPPSAEVKNMHRAIPPPQYVFMLW